MLQNLRLWAKVMLAMGITAALVVLMLSILNLNAMDRVITQAERSELDGHVRAVSQAIAMESRTAEALSSFVASMPVVQDAFGRDDRAALSKLLLPTFKPMSSEFGVEQFQFHTPPATSYLRLHKPEKFGDDLSSFRFTVVDANKTGKAARGLEGGVAGLGIRGVVPVYNQGAPVGSVEFGMTFGQAFFDSFKSRQGVDVALHLIDKEKNKTVTFASTMGKEPIASNEALLRAFAGEPQLIHTQVHGASKAVYAAAMQDYSGKAIGIVEVAMDRTVYQASYDSARTTSIIVGLAALLGGLLLALLTARGLTRRINALMVGVHHVAQGDLTMQIAVDGNDELGDLARAAGEMREQLHALALEVRNHAHAVHAAAGDIAGAVEGQAATSSEMSASVAEITSTMEELSASSTQIAEHSKSVVDIANTTYENSKKGTDSMQMVLSRMGDIQQDNQNSLNEILELGAKSKEISKVMEIINAVADQTKLIAFNAALEAAGAGESGRRFGVVAAEIRRLADNVTSSTGEIEQKINQIQVSISRLVVTSEKGAAGIESGMNATGSTADRLDDLVEAARHTSSSAQQISLSTQQQKTASNQVVVALREIVSASSHTAQSISRISDVSRDMMRLSTELDTLVNRFKLNSDQPA